MQGLLKKALGTKKFVLVLINITMRVGMGGVVKLIIKDNKRPLFTLSQCLRRAKQLNFRSKYFIVRL